MSILENGTYYVSIVDKQLLRKGTGEDFSVVIKNFNLFEKIGVDINGDLVELKNIDTIQAFVHYPLTTSNVLPLKAVVDVNIIEENRDEEYKKSADNLMLATKAFVDAGFTIGKVVKLENAILWKEEKTGKYFLRLEYLCENDDEIYRVIYPKVDSAIPTKCADPNLSFSLSPLFNEPDTLTFDSNNDRHYIFPDDAGNCIYRKTLMRKFAEKTTPIIEE